jgi:hypothetical protein
MCLEDQRKLGYFQFASRETRCVACIAMYACLFPVCVLIACFIHLSVDTRGQSQSSGYRSSC